MAGFPPTPPTPKTLIKRINRPLKLGILGDSRHSNCGQSGSQPRVSQAGFAYWLQVLSQSRVMMEPSAQFAVAGKNSTQVLDEQLGPVLATDVDMVAVLASVNDSTEDGGATWPYGKSASNVEAIVRAVVASGKYCLLFPELPRFGGWGATRLAQHHRVRERCMDLAKVLPNVIVPDTWPVLAADDDTGEWKAGYTLAADSQPTHPTVQTVYLIAQACAAKINDMFTEPVILPVVNTGYYDVDFNPYGILTTNPMMAGTTGTKQVGTAGTVTGDVATGWTATNVPSGSNSQLSIVASKVTAADGKMWQQLVVTGTGGTTSDRIEFYQTFTTTKIATGDVVEAFCDLEVDAGTAGMWGPSLEIGITGGSPTNTGVCPAVGHFTSGAGSGDPVNVAWAGQIITPRYTVLGTPTGARVSVFVRGEQSVAGTITFRVRGLGIRRVPAA